MNKHYAAALTAVFFWGASFIATSIAYATIAPLQLGMIRAILAAILFGIFRLITHDKEKPAKTDRMMIAAGAFLGITIYFTLENLGIKMTTASNAALIVASFPAITVLLESILERTLPSFHKIMGIAIAIAGVAVLTGTTAEGSSNQVLGNVLLITAGIVWAVFTLVSRKVAGKYSSGTVTAYQMLYGGIFFIPFVWIEGAPWIVPTPATALAILFLSFCCSLLGYLLYNYGLQKISAGAAVSLMNLVPVLGIFFSFTILHEVIVLRQILGGIIVILGVTLSSLSFERK